MELGFVINWDKSVLTPSKQITYLGFVIDSDSMNVTLPEDKAQNVVALCRDLADKEMDSVRNVAKVMVAL